MKEIKTEKKARKIIEIVLPNKETGQELEVILVITYGWRIFGIALLMGIISMYVFLNDSSITTDSVLSHMKDSFAVQALCFSLFFLAGIANVFAKSGLDAIRNFLSVLLIAISFSIFTL